MIACIDCIVEFKYRKVRREKVDAFFKRWGKRLAKLLRLMDHRYNSETAFKKKGKIHFVFICEIGRGRRKRRWVIESMEKWVSLSCCKGPPRRSRCVLYVYCLPSCRRDRRWSSWRSVVQCTFASLVLVLFIFIFWPPTNIKNDQREGYFKKK